MSPEETQHIVALIAEVRAKLKHRDATGMPLWHLRARDFSHPMWTVASPGFTPKAIIEAEQYQDGVVVLCLVIENGIIQLDQQGEVVQVKHWLPGARIEPVPSMWRKP